MSEGMTDIEIKRKELETAKRIKANNYECTGEILVRCLKDEYCPCSTSGGGCRHWIKADWDAFIATREAELAALDKAQESLRGDGNAGPSDGLSHVQTAPMVGGYVKIGEIHGAVGKAFDVYDRPGIGFIPEPKATPSPTLDDFALALIQGGYFNMTMGEEAAIENLVSRAGKIKAELDRRRGA